MIPAARMTLALCCCCVPGFAPGNPQSAGASAAVNQAAPAGVLEAAELRRKIRAIVPGQSTKAQVAALLGRPWRTVEYNDLDEVENEIWEYRGVDGRRRFRLHLEFDQHERVTLLGEVADPDSAAAPDSAPTK
jgi:hypothetical protein